ncbi:MAG: glycine--tRNA ligase subunit beta [Polyangiaceae bacterium]
MTAPHDLLLEIGVEELPSSFVDAAIAALPALVESRLGAVRLTHGAVKAYATPRRLAVVVEGLADAQLDLDEEVTGPPETAAFKDGKPTKAAEAFATKLGIPVSELVIVDKGGAAQLGANKQKPGKYVVGRRVEKGKPARELLGKVLADVCGAIPFKKSMRWGAGDATFGRPVQWLVALHGEQLVDVAFAGVRSTAKSRGHRFLSPDAFVVKNAGAYLDQLRHHHVLADRDERAKTMMDRVSAAARAAGGTYDPEPSLIDENASLVEEPHAVTGSFDPAFLELPAAVIRAVARGHQKYFCVQKSQDELLPHYITVANTALAPEKIAKGNNTTMRARLSDARFFFEEDKKAKLEDRVEKLAGIVFHNKLGTVREKIVRIERLAGWLAGKLGMDGGEQAHVTRAAHLCKSDLVSLMVGEFPELQGAMGRTYALHAGEPAAVADAIRDHYRPAGASDDVSPGDVGAIVGLADRLDSLVGCFGIGLAPTGAADPFALRRACIGVLRTILDKGGRYGRLTVSEMLGAAYDGYDDGASAQSAARSTPGATKKLELEKMDTVAKVEAFTADRFRGLLASETSNAVADAVMAGHNQIEHDHRSATEYPVFTRMKARVLHAAVLDQPPWLEKARTVAKRLSGISKEHPPRFHVRDDFTKSEDALIHDVVRQVHEATRALTTEAAVSAALGSAIDLAQKIDAIFLSTLVNDPADPLTPKRLELLSYGADCMLRLADFARLGGAAT